jgi:hypothetical protein
MDAAEAIADSTFPFDDVTYAAALPGEDLLVGRRLVHDYSSVLLMHLFRLGEGRRIIMHVGSSTG